MASKRQLVLFSSYLLLYQLSTYLANDVYVPALPAMIDYFQCTREAVEWTVAAFIIGSPLCVLFVGPLAEHFGRRPCLLGSGTLFIGSSLLCTIVKDVHILIALRLIEGSAIGFIMVAGYATLQEVFQGKEGFAILGRMASIAVLAPALGPVIGSFLLQFGSWHISFYVVAMMALVAMIGLYKTMPQERKKEAPFALKSVFPNYGSLLKNLPFCLGCILGGLILAEFFAWITLSPAMIISHFEVSVQAYGWIQVPVIGAFSLSSLGSGRLVRNYQPEALVKLGFAINLLGCFCFFISSLFRQLPLLDLIIAMSLCSLGAGLVCPLLNRLTLFLGGPVPMNYRTALYHLIYIYTGVSCSIGMSKYYTLCPHPQSFGFYITVLGLLASLGMYCRHKVLRQARLYPRGIQPETEEKVPPPLH